ncbi:MAG: alanine--tRNA ligase [Helicobacter sp.]|nr:alanine--tRNA ligase [Helicobacter sp.]
MDIRSEFLRFFESKGHKIYASSPLVPDDNSLLFTNAGMVAFKDIFTGQIPTPNPPKATSSQLCIRAGGKHNDLENVGFTRRHHTLFEMLGNFSFGDYFKREAIKLAYEFITEILRLDKNRLYISVHEKDTEALQIWSEIVPPHTIKKLGDKDNFWAMGDTGPCGYCSEIFYDQGEHFNSKDDYFGGDGDRFLEIWNLVFMEFEKSSDGTLSKLPKPSIDTGMGLERITAILEGKDSNFDTSLFMPLILEVERISGLKYSYHSGSSFRVIADHARSVAFLLAQGVFFSKDGRGYVLRKILRRAVRHGYLLGLKEPFLYKIVSKVCELFGNIYPYLNEQKDKILSLCKDEEKRFFTTIASGLALFETEVKRIQKAGLNIFDGEVAFKLYDTFGFPLDLTNDMTKELGLNLDFSGFDKAMEVQKSQSLWKGSSGNDIKGDFKEALSQFGINEFTGYEKLASNSTVLALFDSDFKLTKSLTKSGFVMFDKTPFYAQSGGQIGDSGSGKSKNAKTDIEIEIIDTKKYFELNISEVQIKRGILQQNDELTLQVSPKRNEISKHHSATHLLHASLQAILGDSVSQAGSLVQDNRLRFDFTFNRALSEQEKSQLEDDVNAQIKASFEAKTTLMPIDLAKKSGAKALFGEKYGDIVRVVELGSRSVELCGGTHVKNTSEIGAFFITKESSVSTGVRRIEAICGDAALNLAKIALNELKELRTLLKSNDLKSSIKALQNKIKNLESKQNTVELKPQMIDDIALIIQKVDAKDLKSLVDVAKNTYKKVAIILANENLQLACGVKDAKIDAKEWLKYTAHQMSGSSGGRSDFATGGGKDASKLEPALKAAYEYALEILGAP